MKKMKKRTKKYGRQELHHCWAHSSWSTSDWLRALSVWEVVNEGFG